MKFGSVPLLDAEGAILAHSVGVANGRLRKGRVLTPDDLVALRDAGLDAVTVAILGPNDVHEDAAALQLAQAMVSEPTKSGLRLGNPGTGRVNIFSDVVGVADINADAINAANAIDPMITVATVPRWQRMARGGMVATVKIIAYGVSAAALEAVCESAHAALRMRPTATITATLIETSSGEAADEKGHRAIQKRLEALQVTMLPKTVVPHEEEAVAQAIRESSGDVILILTASATSDIRDTAPAAVLAAGGTVTHFGMPVDPGNLLFLGEIAGKPVIGLPGCARSPAQNGADWVLERIVCGVPVTSQDIACMGVGGLLKEISTRPHPRRKGEK